jgi:hypothetical protein
LAWLCLAEAMRKKFGVPVKLLNDADVQGLAAIQGKGLSWSAPWAPVSAPPGFATAN